MGFEENDISELMTMLNEEVKTIKTLGVPIEQWNMTKEEIRQILIGKAKEKGFISYSDLVNQLTTMSLDPYSAILWNMLGE